MFYFRVNSHRELYRLHANDPLLALTGPGGLSTVTETVNLWPLISCNAIVTERTSATKRIAEFLATRLANQPAVLRAVRNSGWTGVVPHSSLRSGILLLRDEARRHPQKTRDPEAARAHFQKFGIALSDLHRWTLGFQYSCSLRFRFEPRSHVSVAAREGSLVVSRQSMSVQNFTGRHAPSVLRQSILLSTRVARKIVTQLKLRYAPHVPSRTSDTIQEIERSQFREVVDALGAIPTIHDPLFRELALARTAVILNEAKLLAAGEIVFNNTETWRAAYEKLLVDLDFSTYLSVAWVRTSDYWRDQAGRRSIRLNYELLDKGLRIERILILPDSLWKPGAEAPRDSIRTWIEEQHYRGIALSLVRESDLAAERDLIADFGVYGTRAAGEQDLDELSRTIRFRLCFSPSAIQSARLRWNRLSVFSVFCQQALDLA